MAGVLLLHPEMNLPLKGDLKMTAQEQNKLSPYPVFPQTPVPRWPLRICSPLLYYFALPQFMKSLLCSNLVSQQVIHSLSGLDLKCTQRRETVKWQTCPYRCSDKRKAKISALRAQDSVSNLTSFFSPFQSFGSDPFNIRYCNDTISISTGFKAQIWLCAYLLRNVYV